MCWQQPAASLGLQDVQIHESDGLEKTSRFLLLLLLPLVTDSHFGEWHQVTYGEPVECGSSWHGAAICWGGKNRRGVYLGLLEWRHPLSKRCFSCQLSAFEQTATHLHLISPTTPPRTSGRVGLFHPPQHISELLICFMLLLSGSKFTLGQGFFSQHTELLLLPGKSDWWTCVFHSFQVWSAWLKRHDLVPWWAYGLKTLSDCLAISPTLIESLMWTRRILIKTRGYRHSRRTI